MRKLAAFTTGFAVVLIAGVAMGMVGSVPDEDVVGSAVPAEPEALPLAKMEAPSEPVEKRSESVEQDQAVHLERHQRFESVEDPSRPKAKEPPVEDTRPADTEPPVIEILHPGDGQVFEAKEVAFEGVTEPGARVLAGPYEAEVAADGTWRIVLWLSKGTNLATLKAVDAAGNHATDSVSVTYQPPAGETHPDKDHGHGDAPKDHDDGTPKDPTKDDPAALPTFVAEQVYGSCSEDPPYDVFRGTARPGATVKVRSGYGGGETVVSESGHWELKVTFPKAPPGETFQVKVKDSDGRWELFEFTFTP